MHYVVVGTVSSTDLPTRSLRFWHYLSSLFVILSPTLHFPGITLGHLQRFRSQPHQRVALAVLPPAYCRYAQLSETRARRHAHRSSSGQRAVCARAICATAYHRPHTHCLQQRRRGLQSAQKTLERGNAPDVVVLKGSLVEGEHETEESA